VDAAGCTVAPALVVAAVTWATTGLATWGTAAAEMPGASPWARATAVVSHIAETAIGTQTRPIGTGSRTPGTAWGCKLYARPSLGRDTDVLGLLRARSTSARRGDGIAVLI